MIILLIISFLIINELIATWSDKVLIRHYKRMWKDE